MLRQPREGLGTGEWLTRDVCCRRSVFEHGEVSIVLAGHARIRA